ncbi:MAG: hypothetical protein ACRYG8_11400 [Janthinobacterium lividum]
MPSRYCRDLTAVPAVRLSLDRTGVATTIGGRRDVPHHSGSGARRSFSTIGDPRFAGPLPTDPHLIPGTRRDYGGGDVTGLTSPGLDSLKTLLLATEAREREIRNDLRYARFQLGAAWLGWGLGWMSLVSAVSKNLRLKASGAVERRKTEVGNLGSNLAASRISIKFDMTTEIAGPHQRMQEALDGMASSSASWVVQTEQRIDRVRARTTASTVVGRAPTKLSRREHALIGTDEPPITIKAHGGRSTVFLYPGFALVARDTGGDFALVDMKELDVQSVSVGFTETERVPPDSVMIGRTWAKSNKDGSRDRRFKDNQELPVMQYGQIRMSSGTGLDEALMFSRAAACTDFARAVMDLKRLLGSGGTRQVATPPTALPGPRGR